MNSPLLSVIVPVHNGEEYLGQCLESIAEQTLADMEIIVADDASSDNSWNVIKKWADEDSRFRPMRNAAPSGNPGSPRNLALNAARGKYIGFVDCDDWIERDYFENFQISFSENADIIQSAGFYDHRGEESSRVLFEHPIMENKNLKKFIRGNSIWDKVYNRNFLLDNNIYLGTSVACVDIPFVVKAGYYCERAKFVSQVGYHYRRGLKGSTISLRESTDCDFVVQVWNDALKWAKSIGVDNQYMNLIHFKMVNNLIYTLTVINYKYFNKFYLIIREIIRYIDIPEIISIAKCMGYEDYLKLRINGLMSLPSTEYAVRFLGKYRDDIDLIVQVSQ